VRGPQSWASSLVGLALALLLASWALQQFAAVVRAVWPVLAGVAILAALGAFVFAYLRRTDRW
jgi:predicted neutral ceramidase superfamily lipid hydrolase